MVLENKKITYADAEALFLTAIHKNKKDLAFKLIKYIQNTYKVNYSKTFLRDRLSEGFKIKKATALKKISKMGFIYNNVIKTEREIIKFPKKVECLYYKVLPYNINKGCCFDGKRAIFQTYNNITKSYEDIASIKNGLGIVCEYDFYKSKSYYFEKPIRKTKTFKFLNCSF